MSQCVSTAELVLACGKGYHGGRKLSEEVKLKKKKFFFN